MRPAQIVLFAGGAVFIGIGIISIGQELAFTQIVGLLVWLATAIVVHDAVLVPLLSVLNALVRRAGRRLPRVIVMVAEAGFVVGALITAVVIPELIAQQRGAVNPTVLPGDYASRLGFVWLGIALAVTIFALIVLMRHRDPVAQAEGSSVHHAQSRTSYLTESDDDVPPLSFVWRGIALGVVALAVVVVRRRRRSIS